LARSEREERERRVRCEREEEAIMWNVWERRDFLVFRAASAKIPRLFSNFCKLESDVRDDAIFF